MPPLTSTPRRHAKRSADPSLIALGDEVRSARVRANLSQQDLALASGVGRTTVVKLENGQPGVSLGGAQRILKALRMRLAALPR